VPAGDAQAAASSGPRRPPLVFTLDFELDGNRKNLTFKLAPGDKDKVSLGRLAKNDITLEHPGVSGTHAEFSLLARGEGLYVLGVKDSSTNGTGVRRPGEKDDGKPPKLPKGEVSEVPHAATIILPIKGASKPPFKIAVTYGG